MKTRTVFLGAGFSPPMGFLLIAMACPKLCAQPSPHSLSSISVAPNGAATLGMGGSASNLFPLPDSVSFQFAQMFDLYPIDVSPDLLTWTRQAMLQRTIGNTAPLLYQETNPSLSNARFYRTPSNHFITPFLAPTGPFAVGTLDRILTDPSRPSRANFNPTLNSFMCTVWYPADPPTATALPGPYLDSPVAGDVNLIVNRFGWDQAWTNVLVRSVAHSFPGLPLAAGTNRFPLILYSHGYPEDRKINSCLVRELASRGYIIASVDHIDCHCTVFPDGRGVVYTPPGTITNFCGLANSRVLDLLYLVGQLPAMDATDAVLAGRLDLGHIASLGWSFGGGTAANIGWASSSISCAVLLDPFIDPNCNPHLRDFGLQKPFLTMTCTVWAYPNTVPSPSVMQGMSSNLFYHATADATWFSISNSHHQAFCDFAWDMDLTSESRQQASAITESVLWFFDNHLKGTSRSFPTNAEIINVQMK